jgi:serine/threonine-protein kinase RsbW
MALDLVLDLPNDLASIEEAVDFVMERCSGCGDNPRRLRLNLRVGLSEALANAMLYGNAKDSSKRVKVEVAFQGSTITTRVTDEGEGFDPHHLPDPTSPANILKAEGRGIFLMRKLLDEVYFNDCGNSVTLVLRLPPFRDDVEVDGGARA